MMAELSFVDLLEGGEAGETAGRPPSRRAIFGALVVIAHD
jgi:hypothetical protein